MFKCNDLKNKNKKIEDKKGLTPLHLACKYGSEELISLLIDKTDAEIICSYKSQSVSGSTSGGGTSGSGGSSNVMSISTTTSPIHLICKNKEEKLDLVEQAMCKLKRESTDQKNYVEYILKKEDITRQTIAHLAIANNHLRILELLFVQFDLDRDVKVFY